MTQQTAKQELERLLATQLVAVYSSRDEQTPDERYGHYTCYEAHPNPIAKVAHLSEPPFLKVYDQGLVQLYLDSVPRPVAANTAKEQWYQIHSLCEYPVRLDQISRQDWLGLVEQVLEEFA